MMRGKLGLVFGLLSLVSCEGGGSAAIQFEGERDFLEPLDQDTGFLPADSPAQVRLVTAGSGTLQARARGTFDGSELTPAAGSGELSASGELRFEVYAKIDTAGINYEGLVDSVAYAVPASAASFDPFLLDTSVDVVNELPPMPELAVLPIPSVPGAELVLGIAGGTLTTSFRGVCAQAADGRAQYAGRTVTSGTVDVTATVRITIPLRGTEMFGPFDIAVEVPALESELDLGTFSIADGQRITEGPFPCDSVPIPDAGTGEHDAGPPDGGRGPCGPGSCLGCCDSRGVCQMGLTDDAVCGRGGTACEVCADGFACSSGRCEVLPCAESCAGCCMGETCLAGDARVACGSAGAMCIDCGTNHTCELGECRVVETSSWDVYVLAARVPGMNAGGDAWDPFGGLPDVFVDVVASSGTERRGTTSTASDTIGPSWSERVLMALPPSDLRRITFTLVDDDAPGDDRMSVCELMTAETDFGAPSITLTCPASTDPELVAAELDIRIGEAF